MPSIQELCRVRITWLKPGDVCLETKLGLSEFSQPNLVARSSTEDGIAYRELDKEDLLDAMLRPDNRVLLEGAHCENNSVVEVIAPVTVYEFDVTDTAEAWLARDAMESGAEAMFEEHLDELHNIGLYLWNRGKYVDRGRWGISVCFHTLWVYKTKPSTGNYSRQFAGLVDVESMPLSLFAQKPAAQSLPERLVAPR